MKTGEDFKNQAKEKGITKWDIHDCSMCNYNCGFCFRDNDVYYDNGCYCIMRDMSPSSWEDVANHYNRQTHPNYIEEMDQFWGFSPQKPTS